MLLESWCSLLTLDFYLEICRAVDCLPETEEEQVSLALNESIYFDLTALPSIVNRSKERNKDGDRDRDRNKSGHRNDPQSFFFSKHSAPAFTHHMYKDGFSPPVTSLWKKTKGDLVSGSILNSFIHRSMIESKEIESMSCLLEETRRSVEDLQAILLLQFARIASTDTPPHSPNFHTRSILSLRYNSTNVTVFDGIYLYTNCIDPSSPPFYSVISSLSLFPILFHSFSLTITSFNLICSSCNSSKLFFLFLNSIHFFQFHQS